MSAAFHTVDHKILINILESDFSICGDILKWLRSYLTGGLQHVIVNQQFSKIFDLNYGVSQGSCLGPVLFALYESRLFEVVKKHLSSVHGYADDVCVVSSRFVCHDRLQNVLNVAARVICMISKFAHITPVRWELHWLPVKFGVEFKIALLVFKTLKGLAPQYLAEVLVVKPRTRCKLFFVGIPPLLNFRFPLCSRIHQQQIHTNVRYYFTLSYSAVACLTFSFSSVR